MKGYEVIGMKRDKCFMVEIISITGSAEVRIRGGGCNEHFELFAEERVRITIKWLDVDLKRGRKYFNCAVCGSIISFERGVRESRSYHTFP